MSTLIKANHGLWMRVALEEADAASISGEIPIGAVVVAGDRIIGRGHNRSIGLSDPIVINLEKIPSAANSSQRNIF